MKSCVAWKPLIMSNRHASHATICSHDVRANVLKLCYMQYKTPLSTVDQKPWCWLSDWDTTTFSWVIQFVDVRTIFHMLNRSPLEFRDVFLKVPCVMASKIHVGFNENFRTSELLFQKKAIGLRPMYIPCRIVPSCRHFLLTLNQKPTLTPDKRNWTFCLVITSPLGSLVKGKATAPELIRFLLLGHRPFFPADRAHLLPSLQNPCLKKVKLRSLPVL